jgi:hypothetical protein
MLKRSSRSSKSSRSKSMRYWVCKSEGFGIATHSSVVGKAWGCKGLSYPVSEKIDTRSTCTWKLRQVSNVKFFHWQFADLGIIVTVSCKPFSGVVPAWRKSYWRLIV